MLRSAKTLLATVLSVPLLLSAAARAEDWPQWRGPNRDGVCGETGLLQSFPAESLKVRWRAPVGWGFSSPVVAQGRVYLADSEVVKPKAKERLHCFDETTGTPLWTHVYEVSYEDWAFDPKQEIGPVATPIIHNGKVYTLGRLGHLFCLDARTGGVLWRRNLEQDYHVAFAPGTPSPLIEGDLLILLIGGKPDKGELIRAQLTSQGYKEISRVAVLEPTFPFGGRNVAWSAPAYANRHILARNGKELICACLAVEP